MSHASWLVLLAACSGGTIDFGGKDTAVTAGDADTDADADSDADADADSDADADTDTDTDLPPGDVIGQLDVEFPDIVTVPHVTWEVNGPVDTWVEYRFDDDEWLSTPIHEAADGDQWTAVLGVPVSTSVELRAVAMDGDTRYETEIESALTGAAPSGLGSRTLVTWDPAHATPEPYIIGAISEQGSYFQWFLWIADREGRLVWWRELPYFEWDLYIRLALDGETILYQEAPMWVTSPGAKVVRLTLDGATVEDIDTPGLNHAFAEFPGGMAWPQEDGQTEDIFERLDDGTERIVWDAGDWFSSIGRQARNRSNALRWVESTDTFLFSWFDNEHIIEVDHASGEVLRVFGDDLPGHYSFDPPSAAFDYQHCPNYTDEGTLMVMSTGTDTVYEYEVDDASKTLRRVWELTRSDHGVNTDQIGEAWRLPNGNTFINFGTEPVIMEVTPDKDIVYQLEFTSGWMGATVLLDDLYRFCPDC